MSQPGSNSVYSKPINTTTIRTQRPDITTKELRKPSFPQHQKTTRNPQDYQKPKTKNHSDHITNNNKRKKGEPTKPTRNNQRRKRKQPEKVT